MDRIVLPLTLPADVSDDSVLANNKPGFQPFDADGHWTLEEIGEKYLKAPVDKEKDGDNTAYAYAGEGAIPDVCAHILYLRAKLNQVGLDMKDEAVRAWVGVMALIALEEQHINIKVMDMSCGDDECLKKTYQEALKRAGMLDAKNQLYILSYGETEIAALDPPGAKGDRCFCYPFSAIDDNNDELKNIPWFISGRRNGDASVPHQWLNVTGNLPNTMIPFLNQSQKTRFVQMLCGVGTDSGSSFVSCCDAVRQLILRLNPKVFNCDTGEMDAPLVDADHLQPMNMERMSNEVKSGRPNAAAKYMFDAWTGILACIGLSKLRSYSVTLEPLRGDSVLMNLVYGRRCRLNEIILVKINGVPVGTLDRKWLVKPFYFQYLGKPNVPWYWGGEGEHWLRPEGAISKIEASKLAGWFFALANGHNNAKLKVVSVKNRLFGNAKLMYAVENAVLHQGSDCRYSSIETLKNGLCDDAGNQLMSGELLEVAKLLSSVPDFLIPMPTDDQIFTPVMGLTLADGHCGKFGRNRLGVDVDESTQKVRVNTNVELRYSEADGTNARRESYQAFLPLTARFTEQYLTPDKNGKSKLMLKSFELQYDMRTRCIIAKLKLKNGGDDVNRIRRYSVGAFAFEQTRPNGNVVFFQYCPYVCMWPYINSPAWKKYYVVVNKNIKTNNPSANINGGSFFHKEKRLRLTPLYSSAENGRHGLYSSELVKPLGEPANSKLGEWEQQEYKHFPDYIPFGYRNGAGAMTEVGSIYVARPKEKKPDGTQAAVIDFGTSNTIVRMFNGDGKLVHEKVFSGEWTMPLVQNGEEDYIRDVQEFHDHNWLSYDGGAYVKADGEVRYRDFWPKAKNDGGRIKGTDHIPTMVRLFEGANHDHCQVPRYGLAMKMNYAVMHHFMSDANQKVRTQQLSKYGIKNDIKCNERDIDPTNGSIFIETVVLLSALNALKNDCKLNAVITYPDRHMWNNPLASFWYSAVANANEMCSSITISERPNDMLTTSELWGTKHYAERHIGPMKVNFRVGYCVIDIGGGTSDISIMQGETSEPPMKGALSLRYAGRQIISESVYSAYCRDSVNFESLWDSEGKGGVIDGAFKKFMEIIEDRFRYFKTEGLNNGSMENTAKAEIPMLVDMVISRYKRTYGGLHKRNLQTLLNLKLGHVIYVVANFIKELNIINPKEDGDFVVIFAGGGASAHDMCNTGELDAYLADIMSKVIMKRSYTFISAKENERKTEVVNGVTELAIAKLSDSRNGDVSLLSESDIEPVLFNPDKTEKNAELIALQGVRELTVKYYDEYVENILQNQSVLALPNNGTIYQMLTRKNKNISNDLFYNVLNGILTRMDGESALEGLSDNMKARIAVIRMIDYFLLVYKFAENTK